MTKLRNLALAGLTALAGCGERKEISYDGIWNGKPVTIWEDNRVRRIRLLDTVIKAPGLVDEIEAIDRDKDYIFEQILLNGYMVKNPSRNAELPSSPLLIYANSGSLAEAARQVQIQNFGGPQR